MRRSIVILAAVALLGVLGVYTPAQAGTGSSAECTNTAGNWGRIYVPILTSPVTLTLEFGSNLFEPHPQYAHAALCYSTSPVGYSGQDTTGGRIEVNVLDNYRYEDPHPYNASCQPQSNPSSPPLTTSCYAGTDGSGSTVCVGSCSTVAPWVSLSPLGTVSFGVPITTCLAGCTTQNPSLGPTGVIVGSGGPTGGPAGTTTGAGYTVQSLAYCVNGSCQSLTPATYVGAGLTPVSAGPTSVVCGPGAFLEIGGGWCIPGTVTAHVGGTIAAVQVGSTMIPVNSPVGPVDECIYSWEVVYEEVVYPALGAPGQQIPSPCG